MVYRAAEGVVGDDDTMDDGAGERADAAYEDKLEAVAYDAGVGQGGAGDLTDADLLPASQEWQDGGAAIEPSVQTGLSDELAVAYVGEGVPRTISSHCQPTKSRPLITVAVCVS